MTDTKTHGGRRLALLLAASACGLACSEAPADERPPNLVLVIVDTLRADRVVGPHERETTPALASLGERGVVFERAYSTAPWTMPSVASILTGLFPEAHRATTPGRMLPSEVASLPELLREEGYATSAVISHKLIGTRYRFEQGFERFDEEEAQGHGHVSTPGVTERARAELERLQGGNRPFFLLVHYFDPHAKYRRHKEYGYSTNDKRVGRLALSDSVHKLRDMRDLTPEEVKFLTDRYDEEVRFTDDGIGRLFERLTELGLDETTYVAVCADHGEEFWDHGGGGHTRTLFEELVHVPWVLCGPDVSPGRRIAEPVSLVQLAPTLLDLMGFEDLAGGMQSRSLAPHLRAASSGLPVEPVFTAVTYYGGADNTKNSRLQSIVRGEFKLVLDELAGTVALYDLASDPGETKDRAQQEPELAAELRGLLDAHLVRTRTAAVNKVDTQLSPEELEDLEALGYGGGDD